MIQIQDIGTHVRISTEFGKIVLLPKNQYEIRQDENDANHFIISQSDRIEFDFYWEQVSSPSTANPEALIQTLSTYFYASNSSEGVITAIESTIGSVDSLNSSNTLLNANQTFTGSAVDVSSYPSCIVSCYASHAGTLYVEFSTNGTNWDSSIVFNIEANNNEVHRVSVSKQYYRIRYVNGGTNQTTFRLQSIKGYQQSLTSALNSVIQEDADAIVSRNIDYEQALVRGLFQNNSLVLKSGRNPSITSASVPEDVINGSTPYTGFPLTSPEELQFFSDSVSDTGTVTFLYLATATSTAYQTGTVTLNGTTPVNSGITAYRVHSMSYNNGSTATFNAGTITCRWRTTTSVIFLTIPPSTSQSYSAIYTVPFGCTGYIKRVFCEVADSASVAVQGALWTRLSGQSPRLRRNFSCQTGSAYNDVIYGGLVFPSMTDIALRITNSTSNSATIVVGGFDLILVS